MCDNNWCVYILQCSDGTYYIGITNDIDKRIKCHQSGNGAKYTSGRLPVNQVYCKRGYTESEARREEMFLKKWSREQKKELIDGKVTR